MSIHGGSDDAWLDAYAAAAVEDLDATPVPGNVGEHAVGHRLPGQARAGGPERERHVVEPADREQLPDVIDGLRPDDGLRHQVIYAGIGRVGRQVDRPSQHVIVADNPPERLVNREGHHDDSVDDMMRRLTAQPKEEILMRKVVIALTCVCALSVPLLAATLADVTLPDTCLLYTS